MRKTKVQSEADLMELIGDTDFRYVSDLTDSVKRMAAYYEYARESVELIEVVVELRDSGIFKPEYEKRAVKPELMHKTARAPDIYPPLALYTLTECEDFPREPFREVIRKAGSFMPFDFTLGVSAPGVLPWKSVLSFRNDLMRNGFSELEYFDQRLPGKPTLHAISIPWQYTNDELADFFRKIIPKLRPPGFPEPKKAGRRGRTSGSGAGDMLNQLGAFRLNRAGWKFDPRCKMTQKVTQYLSVKGWKQAIHAAEVRISNMTTRPLFG